VARPTHSVNLNIYNSALCGVLSKGIIVSFLRIYGSAALSP